MTQFIGKVAIIPGGGLGIGQTTALEFAKEGATVVIAKASHPFGQLATTTDIANAVVFLCSDKAAFVTGQSMLVDSGYTAG